MLTAAGCGKKKSDRIDNSEAESSKSSSVVTEESREEAPDEIDVGGESDKGIAVDFDPEKTPSAASAKAETKTESTKSESKEEKNSKASAPTENGKSEETPDSNKDGENSQSSETGSGKQDSMNGYSPWK